VIAETNVKHNIGAKLEARDLDRRIAALAAGQHGVVARRQLAGFGLGRRAISHRLACGRLHAVQRGVYAVGHRAVSREGRWLAAVLAAGTGAALSHRSGVALWQIGTAGTSIEVTVPRYRCSRPGMVLHGASLPADEVTIQRGIPVTTVPRTILDVAAHLTPRQLERVMHEAEVRRLDDRLSVTDLIIRHPHRRGVAALRRILAETTLGTNVSRSDFESAFVAFLAERGLPTPLVNTGLDLGGIRIEPDCLWRSHRVIVELDSFGVHGTRKLFESDRARDRALAIAGWRAIRVTWRQLQGDRAALARDLRALLGSG
jgi:very-short-patch-repair endonuclease